MTAAITTTKCSPGVVGVAYETSLALTGGTATTLAVASGSLPPGLAVVGADLRITGTPTTAGTYTFTLSDDAVTSGSLSIVVTQPNPNTPGASTASIIAAEWPVTANVA